jgi:hypothetical protein
MAFASFIVSIAASHQAETTEKPSPTFQALFEGEVAQYKESIGYIEAEA